MRKGNLMVRAAIGSGLAVLVYLSGPGRAWAQENNGREDQTPVQFHLSNDGGLNGVYTVNPTQRLTIEFVSGQCVVGKGTALPSMTGGTVVLSTTLSGSQLSHFFYPIFLYTDDTPGPLNGLRVFGFTQMTRLYADPGSRVSVATAPLAASGFFCVVRAVHDAD